MKLPTRLAAPLLSGLAAATLALSGVAQAAGPAPAAVSVPASAPFVDDAHVALFKNVSGPIRVIRAGASIDAVPGTTLLVSDKVVSGPDASGGIVFKDGTLVTIGAKSEVLIKDFVFEPKEAKYAFSMYLAKGSAIYSSGKIGKLAPESVRVDTPMATVGVRGTRFIVEAVE